jgi:hypothetical protein
LNEQHIIVIRKLHEDRLQKNVKVRDDMQSMMNVLRRKERKNETVDEEKAIILAIERNQTMLAQAK